MSDITLLPSAKVPLVYPDTNGMTTEWYRFFWNIYGFTGTGVVPVDKGGTGLDTIGNHQIIIGNANNVFEPASFSSSSINISYPNGYVNLELGTSTVTPGTYGSASQVGVFTVNQYGVLTAASNTSIGIDANQIISGTIASARISGSYIGITGVGTLTVGTWNATTIGVAYGGTGQTTYTNGQLLIGNTTGNTLTKATLTAGTAIGITNGAGAITINNTLPDQTVVLTAGTGISTSGTYPNFTITNTAPSSGGTVTSVTGTAPVVSSGGATPAISMAAANTTTNGYLTSTDWNTFNGKGSGTVTSITSTTLTVGGTSAIPTINLTSGIATAGTTGSSTLIPVVTIDTYGRVTSITTASNPQGTVTSVTGTAPVVSSGGATPAISMAAATGSVNGYLTSTDWTTFNNKGSGTITSVAATVPAFLSISGSPITTSGTLAISYSGTALPVANGGTGQTSFTAGYVHFGSFSTDANFFWDNTNKRLGLGTASPSYRFDLTSQSATTSTPVTISRFSGTSSGSATSGFGSLISIGTQNANGNNWLAYVGALNSPGGGSNYAELGLFSGITGNVPLETARCDFNGYLLVGYTSSNGAYKLQVNSQIFATSALIATSDGRYKENITSLDGALDLVMAMNPVQFNWKKHPVHNFITETPTVGFIAQEMEQVLANKPYLNSILKKNDCLISPAEYDELGNVKIKAVYEEFLGLAEGNLVAILTKAIKELNYKFDAYVASHP